MSYLPFDITANRHQGSPTSEAANIVAEPSKSYWQNRVIRYAETVKDFTLKDLCRALGKMPNEISGRISELKMLGLIQETGERRERCAVLEIVKS